MTEEVVYDLIIDYRCEWLHVIEFKKLTKEQISYLKEDEEVFLIEAKQIEEIKNNKIESERIIHEIGIRRNEAIKAVSDHNSILPVDRIWYITSKELHRNYEKVNNEFIDKCYKYNRDEYEKYIPSEDVISFKFKHGKPVDITQKYKINNIWMVNVKNKYAREVPR